MANTVRDFKVGQRVQLHPATDRWMRGDKYGTVTKLGVKYVEVHMTTSGSTLRIQPENLLHVER